MGAVATKVNYIYLIDVKEIDKSYSDYTIAKQYQKDLPIYAVSLVGRVKLYGAIYGIESIKPYFEQKQDKTVLNGFLIKPDYFD